MATYMKSKGFWAITLCRPSGRALLRVSALRAAAAIAEAVTWIIITAYAVSLWVVG